MLKITVELLPRGSEEGKETIATGFIHNDLTSIGLDTGNYLAKFSDPIENTFNTGIRGFDRLHGSIWELIWMCLDKRFGNS